MIKEVYDFPSKSSCIRENITNAGNPIQRAYLFKISTQYLEEAFVREKSTPAKITRKRGKTVSKAIKKVSIVRNLYKDEHR